jgi:hypothetical protein
VLVVAPFSQYDLTLLDFLDERLDTDQFPVSVYVANLQDYATTEQLSADFPGIGAGHQTPILAICDSGSPWTVAYGKKARDIVAQVLGLQADELSRRIVAESPSYVNSAGKRVATADVGSQVERWLAHLGPGSRSFWRLAAEFLRDREQVTFEDLSQHYGIPTATLRSYHRNSYRAIHREEAPDPLPGQWDDRIQANVYRMPDSVRDKILELTKNDRLG